MFYLVNWLDLGSLTKWMKIAPTMEGVNTSKSCLILVSLDTKGKAKILNPAVKAVVSSSKLANSNWYLNSSDAFGH